VEIESLYVPLDDEIEENFRVRYISEKRNERFREILQGWKAEADFTINQRGYDSV
jgi:hypothetical protein